MSAVALGKERYGEEKEHSNDTVSSRETQSCLAKATLQMHSGCKSVSGAQPWKEQ